MSEISGKEVIKNEMNDLKKQYNRRIFSFILLGVIQLIYFVGSFILGRFFGYYEHNDILNYPYNRNTSIKAGLGIFFAGIANALYIGLNKRIALKNRGLNIAMKTAIPLGSWGLSNFVIYQLGYNSSISLWDHVSTLYGVFNRGKHA